MAFGESFLAGHSGYSQAGKIVLGFGSAYLLTELAM